MSLASIGKPKPYLQENKSKFWKGGITPLNKKIRESLKYTNWRRRVFERDNFMCVIGGKKHGNKLEADHIKSFSEFPKDRFKIENGRTLCKSCHKKTDTYGWKTYNKKYKVLQ